MGRDRYFFDKRDWKRRFITYLIIALVAFVPLVAFNVVCSEYINSNALVILLDCVILLVFVIFGNMIAKNIFERRDAKFERLRKEREEIQRRKQQIMQNSYAKKRQERQVKKKEKDDVEVEIVIPQEQNTTKKTRRKQ